VLVASNSSPKAGTVHWSKYLTRFPKRYFFTHKFWLILWTLKLVLVVCNFPCIKLQYLANFDTKRNLITNSSQYLLLTITIYFSSISAFSSAADAAFFSVSAISFGTTLPHFCCCTCGCRGFSSISNNGLEKAQPVVEKTSWWCWDLEEIDYITSTGSRMKKMDHKVSEPKIIHNSPRWWQGSIG